MRSLFLIIIMLGSVSAQGSTFTVHADGSGDFATIQEALSAVNDGDVIQLGDGIYTGPGNHDLDSVEIMSTLESISGDPSLCVIDIQGTQLEPHFGITYAVLGPETILRGITFRNGYSAGAGGVMQLFEASITVENCIFEDSYAYNFGGAVYAVEESSPTFTGCVFRDNTADYYGQGGAVYSSETGGALFENCIFSGNSATDGGAVHGNDGSEIRFINCTLFGNQASSGSGVNIEMDASCRLNNSIVSFGVGGDACGENYGGGYITGCTNIFGNGGGDWVGALAGQGTVNNNSNIDPLFCDQVGGILTLHYLSPCAAENNPCGLLGALPVGCLGIIQVAADGSGDYPTIQAALDVSHPFDTIELGPGNYTGWGNRGAVISTQGLQLVSPGEDSWIDGELAPGPRCLTIMAEDVAITGVGITGGKGAYEHSGGGFRIINCSPVLTNVRIENCSITTATIDNHGGGLAITEGNLTMHGGHIINCQANYGGGVFLGATCSAVFDSVLFESNFGSKGGALFSEEASPVFNDCVFRDCEGDYEAGGVFLYNSSSQFDRCEFEDNYGYAGGALYVSTGGSSTITDCTFSGNSANAGGVVYATGNLITQFDHCTMFNNGGATGGSISATFNAQLEFSNTLIAWGNNGEAVTIVPNATATFTCSNIFGNRGGDWTDSIAAQVGVDGNISEDPQLLLGESGGINVTAASPCAPEANPSCGSIGSGQIMPGKAHYMVLPSGEGMYPTIEVALDEVPFNAVIELGEGVFAGSGNRDLNIENKSVLITPTYYPAVVPVVIDLQGSSTEPHRFATITTGFGAIVEISHLEIRDGWVDGDGGAINFDVANSGIDGTRLTNCVFDHNHCSGRGGAVSTTNNAKPTFTDCSFMRNTADISGMAVFLSGHKSEMSGCHFSNHLSGVGRSVVDASNHAIDTLFEYCTFSENDGGLAIHMNDTDGFSSEIVGCVFGNEVGVDLLVSSAGTQGFQMRQCNFQGSEIGLQMIGVEHGALFQNSFSGTNQAINVSGCESVWIRECNFINGLGSADHVTLSASAGYFEDCEFTDNIKTGTTGALFASDSIMELDDCNFSGNQTMGSGGALTVVGGSATLTRCTFTGNTAEISGGSIFAHHAATTVDDCTISGGVAGTNGGGAYHWGGSANYLSGLVENNSGTSGGGIATSSSAIDLNGLIVSGNTATFGGGLSIFASGFALNNSFVTENSADYHGGLFIYNISAGQITNTVIASNAAISRGSGVSVYNGADVILHETTIANNGGGAPAQVYCELNASAHLDASIVAFATSGSAAVVSDGTSLVEAANCDVFGNVGGDWVEALSGQGGIACNFSLDPEFCDAGLGDYQLAESSPCSGINNPCELWVGALEVGCSGTSPVMDSDLPNSFAVLGNFPNPFNPHTDISFELPADSSVVLEVYDVTGRLVRRLLHGEKYPAGRHHITWDGSDENGQSQSTGIYLYRILVGGKSIEGKMAMIR